MLDAQNTEFTALKTNLNVYQKLYDELRVAKDEQSIKSAEEIGNKIKEIKEKKKIIDLQRCIILSQMSEGIAAIHESGCINRDIKPSNTMIGYMETEEPARDENDNVIRNEKGEIQMKKVMVPYAKLIDQGLTVDMKSGEGLKK